MQYFHDIVDRVPQAIPGVSAAGPRDRASVGVRADQHPHLHRRPPGTRTGEDLHVAYRAISPLLQR